MELLILLILLLILCLSLFLTSPTEENFEDLPVSPSVSDVVLTSCPAGYTSYRDKGGQLMCCQGEIVADRCVGTSCSLSGSGTSCASVLLKDYQQKAKEMCPASLPLYFEDKAEKKKGCTNGSYNPTLTGPKKEHQPTCVIYDTLQENLNQKDSCHMKKAAEEVTPFGKQARVEVEQSDPSTPALIAVHFTDDMGIRHTAYTKASMENYLQQVNPNWREKGIDLSKNVSVAEVAKAYYVDRTLGEKDVQL